MKNNEIDANWYEQIKAKEYNKRLEKKMAETLTDNLTFKQMVDMENRLNETIKRFQEIEYKANLSDEDKRRLIAIDHVYLLISEERFSNL